MAEHHADEKEERASEEHAVSPQGDASQESAKQETDAEQSAQIDDLQAEARRRERNTYWLAFFGFAIAAGSLMVSSLQWWVMREQLADARAQYSQGQLDAIADAKEDKRCFDAALKQQRQAAERQAGLMADSNNAVRDAIAAMEINAAADRELTRRGLRESTLNREVSERALRLSERAIEQGEANLRLTERVSRHSLRASWSRLARPRLTPKQATRLRGCP